MSVFMLVHVDVNIGSFLAMVTDMTVEGTIVLNS